jgi:hypothetical protein
MASKAQSNGNSNGSNVQPDEGAIPDDQTQAALPAEAIVVAPPPARGAPSVPKGFDKSHPGVGRPVRVQKSQLACAPLVATELASIVSPSAEFGPHIPDLASLGMRMGVASAWSAERAKAEAWKVYASTQERAAWPSVLDSLVSFREAFVHALDHDPSVAERYPSLALFYGIATQSAKKGARTRRAKKSAAQHVASATPVKAP